MCQVHYFMLSQNSVAFDFSQASRFSKMPLSNARAARRIQALARGRAVRASSQARNLASGRRFSSGGKPARGNTRAIVISRNPRAGAFLPDRLQTSVSNTFDYYLGVGAATAAAGNYMAARRF